MTNNLRTSKEQFDRQAAHYDAEWNTWSQRTLDWLLLEAEPKSSDVVLDVATGAGFTALAFAPKVASVIGVDVSTGMLEQAKKNVEAEKITNVSFQEASAEELPFDHSTFDIVTCRIAAHHFVNIAAFAAEAFRVLKPSGRLVIADTATPDSDFLAAIWQNEVERLRDSSHGRNYTLNEWKKILGRPGFKIGLITDGDGGIKIPLSSWITKAGCTEEQEAEVRRRFDEAPANVRRQYDIETDENGEVWFTWLRVLIKAVKPPA
jgi:ubiquinone/menaquinone biosynthesis C-methylase UbiE